MMHRVKKNPTDYKCTSKYGESNKKKISVCTDQSAFNKPTDQDMYTSVVSKLK